MSQEYSTLCTVAKDLSNGQFECDLCGCWVAVTLLFIEKYVDSFIDILPCSEYIFSSFSTVVTVDTLDRNSMKPLQTQTISAYKTDHLVNLAVF